MMKWNFTFSRIHQEAYFLFCLLGVYVFVSHFILCLSLSFLSLLGSVVFWIFIYQFSLTLFILLFCFYTLLVGLMLPLHVYQETNLNLSIIASIFESHLSESLEFIATLSYYQIISILIYFSFGFFLLYKGVRYSTKGSKSKKTSHVSLLFLLFLVATFYKPVKEYMKGEEFSFSNIKVYPIHLASRISELTYFYFEQKAMLEQGLNIKPNWQIQSVNAKYDNYVLVIGESMRSDYMSLYGYPIDTTPFLRRTKGIVFNHYVSPAPNTQPSLLHSLYEYNSAKSNQIKSNQIKSNQIKS